LFVGLFSGPAYDRIQNSSLERVVVCNTVPLQGSGPKDKITQISIADLLSEAIARIHLKKSVSALFSKTE
jgi:ribose-phosphate pyrophosphokinase